MPKIDRSGRATNAALATAVLTPDAPEPAIEPVTAPGPVPDALPAQRQASDDEKGGERPSVGSSSRQSSPKRGSSSARK